VRVLIAVWLLLACGEDPRPLRAPARPVSEVEQQIEEELEAPPPSSWPTRIDTLRESVEALTTVDACQAELRDHTATAVAEGLADIGYDGFFEDTCRALDAVRRGSIDDCDTLTISAARAGCRTRLALLHGRPAACPDARVIDGPDPLCVAWARRNADLCRAVAPPDDVRCRAVIAGEEGECAPLRAGDRQRCEAQVRRYASALGEERNESPAAREAAIFHLEAGAHTIDRDVLARGVRAEVRGCLHQIVLASPHGEPAWPLVPGDFRPSFMLTISVPPAELPMNLRLGALEALITVALPEHATLTSAGGATGRVHLERFEPEVGGAVSGTIEGTLTHQGAEIPLEGRFSTFLRDFDPLPDACRSQGG
jgi:hypothetical protein